MNYYWIHKINGQKARLITSPPEDDRIWLELKGSLEQRWSYPKSFNDFWLPITKAEYDSNITLREILIERESQDLIKESWKEVPYDENVHPKADFDNLEVGGTHYQIPIQVWDFVYANKIPFDEASAIKYLCRHKEKNGAEDIKKAISYCKHILKTQYNEVC